MFCRTLSVLQRTADVPCVRSYLRLVQQLQQRYRMEPAGSQGVWSLDDHQFVPFIWGSAQLVDQNRVSPKAIANEDMAQALAKDYLIFAAIQYILKVRVE